MPVFGRLGLRLCTAGVAVWVAMGHQPITRREKKRRSESGSSGRSAALAQVGAVATDLDERGCPGGDTCKEKADNAMWNQACWDCKTCWPWAGDQDCYRDVYCEKWGLTSPKPTYVAVCATDYEQKNAYCKKFAEEEPPEYYEDCMFIGSDYADSYCKKLQKSSTLKQVCAGHPDVGPSYCVSFAEAEDPNAYDYCSYWPQYMQILCNKKKTEGKWDLNCAAHDEVGESYCRGFASNTTIQSECATYPKYMDDFCDTHASLNQTYDECTKDPDWSVSYCMNMARKHNNFHKCWLVPRFNATYCEEMLTVPGRSCADCADTDSEETHCLIER